MVGSRISTWGVELDDEMQIPTQHCPHRLYISADEGHRYLWEVLDAVFGGDVGVFE